MARTTSYESVRDCIAANWPGFVETLESLNFKPMQIIQAAALHAFVRGDSSTPVLFIRRFMREQLQEDDDA